MKHLYQRHIFRYKMYTRDGLYSITIPGKPTGWFHLTMVYQGVSNTVVIYYNGEEVGKGFKYIWQLRISGSGHIVIGRGANDFDGLYSTMEIDELTLWNN